MLKYYFNQNGEYDFWIDVPYVDLDIGKFIRIDPPPITYPTSYGTDTPDIWYENNNVVTVRQVTYQPGTITFHSNISTSVTDNLIYKVDRKLTRPDQLYHHITMRNHIFTMFISLIEIKSVHKLDLRTSLRVS